MLLNTDVKVVGINWKEVGVYLACTHSQEEIDKEGLAAVIPRWKFRPQGGGNRPGITSKRAMMGADDDEEDEKVGGDWSRKARSRSS